MSNKITDLLSIQELVIVVVANNHNPSILNPDFLKYNKIVPSELELSSPPVCAYPIAQVNYKQGISIFAEPERLIFSESIGLKSTSEVALPAIATKYINTLPYVDYSAVGINFKGHVETGTKDNAQKFMAEVLTQDGPWKKYNGSSPQKIHIRFVYPIQTDALTFTIEDAIWNSPDGKISPVLFFSANFHKQVPGEGKAEKIKNVTSYINSWDADRKKYSDIVLSIVSYRQKEK